MATEDARSLVALQQTAPCMRTALQSGLLEAQGQGGALGSTWAGAIDSDGSENLQIAVFEAVFEAVFPLPPEERARILMLFDAICCIILTPVVQVFCRLVKQPIPGQWA